MFNKFNKSKGVAILPTVLLVGGLIIEIAIAGLFIAYFFSGSGFGIRLSNEALIAAQSGIQDGIIMIIRNKQNSPSDYNFSVGNRNVAVKICRESFTTANSCDTFNNNRYEVTAIGSAINKQRRLRAFLNVNSETGEVKVESITEISL